MGRQNDDSSSREIHHLGPQGHVQGQPGGRKAPNEIMGTYLEDHPSQ